MKLFEIKHTFDTPWDTLTLANWRKYPNTKAQHVMSVDVLDRYITKEGILRTERLLVCKQASPPILKTLGILISDTAYFREISELCPVTQTYTATTINLTLTNILTVEETCVFEQDPDDTGVSLFTQKGHVVAVAALSYLGRLVEDAAVSRLHANSHKGRDGLQLVIDTITKEYDELEETLVASLDGLKKGLNDFEVKAINKLYLVKEEVKQASLCVQEDIDSYSDIIHGEMEVIERMTLKSAQIGLNSMDKVATHIQQHNSSLPTKYPHFNLSNQFS